VLEALEHTIALLLLAGGVVHRAIEERPKEVHHARGAVVVGPASRVPGQVDRRGGRPVVAAVGREDLLATSVQTRESNGVFVRLGAAVGEEHLGRAVKGVVEDEFGRPVALGIAVLGRDRGQQLGLFGNRGDDFGC